MPKHIYILDTCVLIHDPYSIYKFAENDIYLPLAVIDDLDSLKTTSGTTGYYAREILRQLDKFDLAEMSSCGVKINNDGGKLYILNTEINEANNESVPNIIRVNSDNAIISACIYLQNRYPERQVSIVTKDISLRIRATSWKCMAENYQSDLITDEIYTGIRNIILQSEDEWDSVWKNKEYPVDALPNSIQIQLNNLSPNEFAVFDWQNKKCFSIFCDNKLCILKDDKNNCNNGYNNITKMGITPKNIEQRCAMEALDSKSILMVSICGPAGTGKTLCALSVALDKVYHGVYDKLIIIKPLVPVSGRDIGFLPGDKYEKIVQWLGPYKDNLAQLSSGKNSYDFDLETMVEEGIIEVEAMTFIQGRSIPRSFIIVDEAQNLSPRECRMIIERCANGSKIALLGDLTQIENPFLDARSCGLVHAINGGMGKKECATITLNKVERSSLAAIASEIFKR